VLLKLSDGRVWLEERGTGRRAELLEHHGKVDPIALGRSVETWLAGKRFTTQAIAAEQTYVVRAEAAETGWKRTIGASPCLEVEINAVPSGTSIDVRPGRVGGAVWAARYFTYSWVAFGVSFVNLKKELPQFVRQELHAHRGVIQAEPKIVGVVETRRLEESLGRDERTIDNAHSDTTVTRSIRATKRWLQSCQLELERSRVSGQSLDLNIADLASLRGSMEETLRRQYSASTEVEQIFEEEVTLTVPPRTSLRLTMDWKRIVQEGHVLLQDLDGRTIEVPFEVAVGVTFDQRQLGETAPQ